jgi:hypothetical protein
MAPEESLYVLFSEMVGEIPGSGFWYEDSRGSCDCMSLHSKLGEKGAQLGGKGCTAAGSLAGFQTRRVTCLVIVDIVELQF